VLRTLLIWGLIAGLCGGLCATGVAKVVGEPPLERAIAWEEANATGHSHEGEVEVSRTFQSGIGLAAGAVIYGVALGGVFALVFAAAYGRVSPAGPARLALVLGAAAFLVLFLVPFLKYPANPPGVGDPDTVGERTALYLGTVAISLLAALAALRLRAGPAANAALYLVIVIAAGIVMPSVREVPPGFPATVLWDFRLASVATQLALWSALALVFAVAAERRIVGARTAQPARS
jgi:predicted cobalt transporter CbtA